MKGKPTSNMPESLRLFALCQAMDWNHLPNAGGVYDQHPKMLDDWVYIFGRKAVHDRREHERHEAEMKRKQKR